MLDTKVAELLNMQVNKELYSAYLYLDFSNYYINEGLEGFGNWYKIQAQEERDHAMLFMQYLQNNGFMRRPMRRKTSGPCSFWTGL